MRALPKAKTFIVMLLTVAFIVLLVTEVARESPRNGIRRTEPIRQNMARLHQILLTLERHFDTVHEVNETEQIVVMQSAVTLLKEYLLPHLAAEEAALYPTVDRHLLGSRASSTEAMRREHDIMRRWIHEMETLANASLPDHNSFARRGERLLGLIEAHFEVDQEVLLPVLDHALPLTGGRTKDRE